MGNMEVVIRTAMNIPTVRVNRVEFLRKELNGKVSDDIIELAIKDGTKKAGVPVELVEKLAKNAINSKALLTVTASFLSGLPGGLVGLLGGSSADIIQYYANFLNLAQKLMYLYGYGDINDLATSQEEIMIIVMGLASGVEVANAFLKKVLTENAGKWAKAIVVKNTSKNVFKVVSEKVLATLGRKSAIRLAEEQATRIAEKAIPVVSGVISGAISAVTFKPMAKNLINHSGNFIRTFRKIIKKVLKILQMIVIILILLNFVSVKFAIQPENIDYTKEFYIVHFQRENECYIIGDKIICII